MPYVNNDGVKIHYEVEGQGTPLMLVHGMGQSMELWRWKGYAKELSKDHYLILIDIRGFGASDKPLDPAAYDFQNRISDLVAVLDELNIAKTGYLGYSMGGKIGFRIPIYAPDRFSYLILGGMGYPIKGKEESESAIAIQFKQDLEDAIREAPDNPMEFFVAVGEKRTGVPLHPAEKAMTLANDARAFLVYNRESQNIISPKAEEVLPNIKIPCLLFTGEADPWCPNQKECAALIPDAKFVSLPGLDHWQTLERIDLVLPHVKEFIAQVS
ncbi:alpha/beta fold hydrolase [Chloroflexota bacterium]